MLATACGPSAAPQRTAHATTDRQPTNATEAALQEGERKTSTDPDVNPGRRRHGRVQDARREYAELHRQLAKGDAKQKKNSDPPEINAAKAALAAKVQAARADAKQGDIFTPAVRPVFRRLLAPELKGEDGRDAKAVLKDDARRRAACRSRSTRSIRRTSRCPPCRRTCC